MWQANPTRPVLQTERLTLSLPKLDDAKEIIAQANEESVAKGTLSIPYPFNIDDALDFISRCKYKFAMGKRIELLIHKKDGQVIGAINATNRFDWHGAIVGYWIGKEYRGKGYCTEALKAMIDYLFKEKKVYKISASHVTSNVASGKVMLNAGMKKEAELRGHYSVDGKPEDATVYCMFQADWYFSGDDND